MITKEVKLAIMKERLNRLRNSPKSIKCPGTMKKLARQVRNLEKEI